VATKSILKDINIKDKKLAHTFVEALGQVKNAGFKQTDLTRECKEMTGDKIKEFFGK